MDIAGAGEQLQGAQVLSASPCHLSHGVCHPRVLSWLRKHTVSRQRCGSAGGLWQPRSLLVSGNTAKDASPADFHVSLSRTGTHHQVGVGKVGEGFGNRMAMLAAEGKMSLSGDAFGGFNYVKLFILKKQKTQKQPLTHHLTC